MKMNLKERFQNYARILSIAKKADKEDYLDTVRICGIGIAVVGSIGFFFYIVSILVGGL